MDLVAARTGHFELESGHHGGLWLDLDGMFAAPTALAPVVADLAARVELYGVDVVCGPLVGGALLAQPVAGLLGTGFAYTERVSTGTGELYSAQYRMPGSLAERLAGSRVAVVDDAINAASATRATVREVEAAGGRVAVLAAMLTLGPTPARYAAEAGLPLEAVAALDNAIWAPADCPRCAAGEPLVSGRE